MDARELKWHQDKIGYFSASKIAALMSASGKWTEANINYLYEIQQQRYSNQPPPQIIARTMQIGIENESYGIEWVRENKNINLLSCGEDFTEKLFIKTDYGFGASPDALIIDGITELVKRDKDSMLVSNASELIDKAEGILEVKCIVGRKETNWVFSPTVPFEKKRLEAFSLHRDQLAGQLLAMPNIKYACLLQYRYQDDDNEFDILSPTDPTRGLLFIFSRQEFGLYLSLLEERIIFANNYLNSGKDPDDVNEEWKTYRAKDKKDGDMHRL